MHRSRWGRHDAGETPVPVLLLLSNPSSRPRVSLGSGGSGSIRAPLRFGNTGVKVFVDELKVDHVAVVLVYGGWRLCSSGGAGGGGRRCGCWRRDFRGRSSLRNDNLDSILIVRIVSDDHSGRAGTLPWLCGRGRLADDGAREELSVRHE